MAKQRLHSSLAEIDLLTREELDGVLHERFNDFARTFYRGVDYYRRIETPGTGTYTSPPVPEGYVWSMRHVGVVLSAADQMIMSLGDTPVNVAAVSGIPGILKVFPQGTNAIPYADSGFSTDEVILNPGEQFSLAPFTAAHTILGVLFIAKQTPAEMRAKL